MLRWEGTIGLFLLAWWLEVGIDDLLVLLGEFGDCTTYCQSDLDSDGDIDDMLAMIGAWGPCPR